MNFIVTLQCETYEDDTNKNNVIDSSDSIIIFNKLRRYINYFKNIYFFYIFCIELSGNFYIKSPKNK